MYWPNIWPSSIDYLHPAIHNILQKHRTYYFSGVMMIQRTLKGFFNRDSLNELMHTPDSVDQHNNPTTYLQTTETLLTQNS